MSMTCTELPLAIALGEVKGIAMPTTICLINQKGGCGKSSTCFHLSGALASTGLHVLLIDADPQGSLSQGFLGSALVEQLSLGQTVALLFDDTCFFADQRALIRPTAFEGISVCPANHHLGPFNAPTPEGMGMDQFLLREFIRDQREFDLVLIDCPPNLYRCSWAAMLAADLVLVPVPPEDFGTQGLRAVHQAIDQAGRLNPELRKMAHVVTRADRRLLVHRSYETRLRELYGELVLTTVIPETSAYKVSLACRKPVEYYSPKSPAAKLTRQLSREILDRIAVTNERFNVA
jgi:chromosome partitioning protein